MARSRRAAETAVVYLGRCIYHPQMTKRNTAACLGEVGSGSPLVGGSEVEGVRWKGSEVNGGGL